MFIALQMITKLMFGLFLSGCDSKFCQK